MEECYNYQLTEWVDKEDELLFATKQLDKYDTDYVIRYDKRDRCAVFTEGNQILSYYERNVKGGRVK